MNTYLMHHDALKAIQKRLEEKYKNTPTLDHLPQKWVLDRVNVTLNYKAYYGVDYVHTH